MNNENNTNAQATELAQVGNELTAQSDSEVFAAPHSLQEQAQMHAKLDALRQELEAGIGDTTKPSELADSGTIFDIVNAFLTTMKEDSGEERSKVVFELVEQDTGVFHRVMQSDDSRGIRRKYAELFSGCRVMGIPTEPLTNYRFVYGDKVVAGNRAIILERAPAQIDRTADASIIDAEVIADAEQATS